MSATGVGVVGQADAEAARRVAWVLEELQHLDLNVVVLPRADVELVEAVDRARDAALTAGRADLLESATRSAREIAMRAFSRSGFSGTWAATEMGASVVRAGDRVAAAEAVEAAATAAVVEDLVDVETVEILRERTDALRRTTGLPAPGALANFASGGSSTRGIGTSETVQVGLGIAVVVAGILVAFAAGALPIGLIVIAIGIALLGSIGRRKSGA
jgi:hypothetical protein